MPTAYYASAGSTWTTWTTSCTSTATTISPWQYWTGASTATTATTIVNTNENGTWYAWTGSSVAAQSVLTPEMRAAAQEQARIYREQEAERQRKATEAKAKARQLLLGILSAKQRAEFEQHGWFLIHSLHYRYRIREGRSANIDVIDKEGKISHRLCAHPYDSVPDYDTMVAQKLMLENAEDEFVRIANRHPGSGEQIAERLH